MNFNCNLKNLNEIISNVSLAVSNKSNISYLEGILLVCENGILTITGYNLELGITKSIEVNQSESGSIILNSKILSDILKKSIGETVNFTVDKNNLCLISAASASYSIMGIESSKYPEFPNKEEEMKIIIETKNLKEMINKTIFAVSINHNDPTRTGSLFDINSNKINIVSIDGFKLAKATGNIEYDGKISFIVPGKSLIEMNKLLNEKDKNVIISLSKNHIVFKNDGYLIYSRLIEGQFIDYINIIPKSYETKIKINTREFINAIERVSIIISDDRKPPIECDVKKNSISILCESSIGRIDDEISCISEGKDLKIGFYNRYMLDPLKAAEFDELFLYFNGPLSPIKITPIDGDSFEFLVMPVRLKYDIV